MLAVLVKHFFLGGIHLSHVKLLSSGRLSSWNAFFVREKLSLQKPLLGVCFFGAFFSTKTIWGSTEKHEIRIPKKNSKSVFRWTVMYGF